MASHATHCSSSSIADPITLPTTEWETSQALLYLKGKLNKCPCNKVAVTIDYHPQITARRGVYDSGHCIISPLNSWLKGTLTERTSIPDMPKH